MPCSWLYVDWSLVTLSIGVAFLTRDSATERAERTTRNQHFRRSMLVCCHNPLLLNPCASTATLADDHWIRAKSGLGTNLQVLQVCKYLPSLHAVTPAQAIPKAVLLAWQRREGSPTAPAGARARLLHQQHDSPSIENGSHHHLAQVRHSSSRSSSHV